MNTKQVIITFSTSNCNWIRPIFIPLLFYFNWKFVCLFFYICSLSFGSFIRRPFTCCDLIPIRHMVGSYFYLCLKKFTHYADEMTHRWKIRASIQCRISNKKLWTNLIFEPNSTFVLFNVLYVCLCVCVCLMFDVYVPMQVCDMRYNKKKHINSSTES